MLVSYEVQFSQGNLNSPYAYGSNEVQFSSCIRVRGPEKKGKKGELAGK